MACPNREENRKIYSQYIVLEIEINNSLKTFLVQSVKITNIQDVTRKKNVFKSEWYVIMYVFNCSRHSLHVKSGPIDIF
jgi:hypothetical protein